MRAGPDGEKRKMGRRFGAPRLTSSEHPLLFPLQEDVSNLPSRLREASR